MYLLNETTTDLLGQIKAKLEAKSAPWDKQNPKKYGKSVSKKEKALSKKKLSKHSGKSVLEADDVEEARLGPGEKMVFGKIVKKKRFSLKKPSSRDKKLAKVGAGLKAADRAKNEEVFSIGEDAKDLLDRIRLEMMDGMEAEDADDNETDVNDAFDLYLDSILERLTTSLNADEDMAIEFIMLMADEMEEEGSMPPMPGEDASDNEVSMWMGAAKTSGFANKVLEMANAI